MVKKATICSLLALVVSLVLPITAWAQEEHPGDPVRFAGEIQSIQGVTLRIETRHQGERLVKVTDDTQFRSIDGEIQDLADLTVGMKALVLGNQQGEMVFARTLAVATRHQLEQFSRFRGEVVSINASTESFTLKNRQDQQETFLSTEDTKYQSRGDLLASFNDLEVGQSLLVITRQGDEGNVALRVLLIPERDGDRPRLDLRVRGQITALSQERLVVEKLDGDRVVFQMTERTKVLGIRGSGLQVGDKVLVAGFEDAEGQNIALLILARRPLDQSFDDGSSLEQDQEKAPLPPGPQ